MSQISDILIIEPDPSLSSKLQGMATQMGIPSNCVAKPDTLIHQFKISHNGAAILGPSLGRDAYLRCIHKIKIIDTNVPILVAVHPGMFSDICASIPLDNLHAVSPKLKQEDIAQIIEKLSGHKNEVQPGQEYPIIVGQSDAIQQVRQMINMMCDKDITVLVTGESGTGKELVARLIHYVSSRNGNPLVKVNCAALPDELLESEIFGFQKGAFTGAHKDKPGRLELAHNGTLFLDEIGDLSFPLQAKVLQTLEDSEFSRLGGTTEKSVDARIVAATNQDLVKKVKDGTFRQDLFYRLSVVNIKVPPLRKRIDDIPLLIDYFLNKCFYETKVGSLKLPDKVLRHMQNYHWPGNIRELENMIRRLVVLGDLSMVFDELHIQDVKIESEADTEDATPDYRTLWSDVKIREVFKDNGFSLKKTAKAFVLEAERTEILKALKETNWNRKRAARMLKVSYKTLLSRITELGLLK